MAVTRKFSTMTNFIAFLVVFLCFSATSTLANRELDENNWKDILEGEWMVEFYAPWCPACNALQSAWKELSRQAPKKAPGMKTGAVDVTQAPGLSGRFIVTALPTIFHVKDGEFRQYKGPRDTDSMMDYVAQQRWKQTDPIPGWKAPNSLQMTLIAEFFKLSQVLRNVHTTLMDTYGLPTWGSYLIFAVGTILIGSLLGLVLVCIIDMLYPPKRAAEKKLLSKAELEKLRNSGYDPKEKSDDDNELLNDDIVDDEEEDQDSDAERNSPSDTDEDDTPPIKSSGDASSGDKAEQTKSEVRKRRTRKAD